MALFTPTNQKRLTNVSVVKLLVKTDKKRHRFEIACYPNKVIAWRQKLESNISEVLQSELVFTNVSKAEIASKDSLKDAFQTTNILEVCKIILEKGELQLTEKERLAHLENITKDLAKIVASKTLNPSTKVCFPIGVIEKMIKDCHINLKPNKSAKQQSLDVIRLLKKKSDVPIEMALFSVSIIVPQKQIKPVKRDLLNFCENIISETQQDQDFKIEAVFEPGNYDLFKESFGDKCTIELTKILDFNTESKLMATDPSTKNDSDDEKDVEENDDRGSKKSSTTRKAVESFCNSSDKEDDDGTARDDKLKSSSSAVASSSQQKKNKEYSSSVKDDSDEDRLEEKGKVVTKKSRRRAKNKQVVTGDDTCNNGTDSKNKVISSDEEEEGKTRRRGKKRGNRK